MVVSVSSDRGPTSAASHVVTAAKQHYKADKIELIAAG